MSISIFDLFSIGIGPSSSHTVGPMRAANAFVTTLKNRNLLARLTRIHTDLYGSLALTGKGHGTDMAILLGLAGHSPELVDPCLIPSQLAAIRTQQKLSVNGEQDIVFQEPRDLVLHQQEMLDKHSNGMRFTAYENEQILYSETYYSIGGGFIVTEAEFDQPLESSAALQYPFSTATELFSLCAAKKITPSQVMFTNETSWRSPAQIRAGLLEIADVMVQSIERGIYAKETTLPGGLNVRRRAPALFKKLSLAPSNPPQPRELLNYLNLYAIAVNEENAAGGRVVTAPTNGAAGVIPAVLHYYCTFCKPKDKQQLIIDFLLTAGAIAILYKKGASISAAEVGCQGEIGVACSMAAGALAAIQGGTLIQIEKAAEIGMEHNLGLTCDPIGGLVQIPCIERNTMGALQAVNAANLALLEEERGFVSLDKVIATMLQTGRDMQLKYKETSLGGLAVNHPEC